ncbi:MAG: agmatine deiminase [Oscillospiraceae bacterium]|nr:agmatine deiminase [Oscillospiraceae bacterium]MBR7084764.1 agmatine deiminase [Oscillospiraceae bacterium]
MTMPKNDGFRMPAEFEPHHGTMMIFPERSGSWPYNAEPALPSFLEIWKAITEDEKLYLITSEKTRLKAETLCKELKNIEILEIPQDDAWARDTAPTFVKNADTGEVRGIDWQFNAWGGTFDGLYANWEQDNALAKAFCQKEKFSCYDAQHFVLEGGSIHANGKGLVLTTEACLLSQGRNPELSKSQIEEMLCEYLNAEKIIWLPRGIYNDETNEHVDNICAFVKPDEVVLAWTENQNDPQYALSFSCLEVLENAGLKVHKLPIPEYPVCVTEHDLKGYVFEEGEDVREVGERLAASYVNFYFTNHSVLFPQFGGENAESDKKAVHIMQALCPDRKIIPISARELLLGGGNIHCLTQQIPDFQRR